MREVKRRVRPLNLEEHQRVIDYFLGATSEGLRGMGVEKRKLPSQEQWWDLIRCNLQRPNEEKEFFFLGWEYEGDLIGHSKIDGLLYGERAYIHLHIWDPKRRAKGLGRWFFSSSLAFFFRNFCLKTLICRPYAENPSPNRLLRTLGGPPVRSYETVPGEINFLQIVNHYEFSKSDFEREATLVPQDGER